MDFCERLNDVMTRRGFTQRELAHLCDVDETSMSRYVNGSRRPCMQVLVRLARELNVSVEYLTGNEKEISYAEIRNLLSSRICEFTDDQRLELMEIIAKKG